MVNVESAVRDGVLELRIDLGHEHGPSKSGKTTIVASTQGNIEVAPGVKLGLNVYKQRVRVGLAA